MPFETPIEMLKRGVTSPQTYEALLRRYAQRMGVEPEEMTTPAVTFANHGRWIALCVCGAGMAVHLDWNFCGCGACFRLYHTVQRPVEGRRIEQALGVVPVRDRRWTADEDLADVERRVKLIRREPIPAPPPRELSPPAEPPADPPGGRP